MVISLLLRRLSYGASQAWNEDLISLLQLDEEKTIKRSFQTD
jgi:hypothetical protein